MDGTTTTLALEALHESPMNPRRRYDEAGLVELAQSLRQGQITPILVRPIEEGFEIAAGHRRLRAARMAGLAGLQAIVREMGDAEFLRVLLVENLQRQDLGPLEEAAGYEELMRLSNMDVPAIAAEIGRSVSYIYDRLKLLQLVPAVRQLLETGQIQAGHAILIARLTPEDQRRVLGARAGASWQGPGGGLFRIEELGGLELEDRLAPVSVRELAAWINDNIRFRPARDADPMLFPDTALKVEAAQTAKHKMVAITYDYRVPDGARDPKERTIGSEGWKRADGQDDTKTCDRSLLGVVVAGDHRGEAFDVCIAKDTCKVHWRQEQKEKAARAAEAPRSGSSAKRDNAEAARKAREEKADVERARWTKGVPAMLAALAEKVQAAPATPGSYLGKVLLRRVFRWGRRPTKPLTPGRTAEDLVRYCAYAELAETVGHEYRIPEATKILNAFGLRPAKLLPAEKVQTSGDGQAAAPRKGRRPAKGKARRRR